MVPANDWLNFPVSSRLHSIFERLADRHEIHVIRYPSPLWNTPRKSKAIVHEANGVAIRDLSLYYALNASNHLALIENILKSCKIDIIVFANILTGAEAALLGKIHGVPLVCDYLDHFPESASSYYDNQFSKSLVQGVVLGITRWNLNKANGVVTVSKSFANWLTDSAGVRNLSLIPNGVDLEVFKPMERNVAQERLGLEKLKQKFVITYTGTVESWYDLDVVAQATHRLNCLGIPSVFQIVGGHLVTQNNNRFVGFENDILQTGFVDHKQVSLYLNASDVCVLPLRKMAKNLTRPLKLLEYFACGKPVLSLPNSELEHEYGDALTIFNSAEELMEIFLKIVADPLVFSSKIERGYKYAQKNSWESHARRYESFLESILRKKVNNLNSNGECEN
ncbi:MAG: glycosyltransferase [Nitrososphaerota archaeon]|nr:glycosyltransferase [Nitrososphaerota archaeon]